MHSLQSIFRLLRDSKFPIHTISSYLRQPRYLTLPQPLPEPKELKARPDLIARRYDGIGTLRQTSNFQLHDTTTASIYRMCEFLCADDCNELMLEVQYFWNNPSDAWRLESIPDPCDLDRERYAVLASIVESLTQAFNLRLEMGLRRGTSKQQQEVCPGWTCGVPPLDYPLELRRDSDDRFPASPSNPFAERQINANAGNIFSI